MTIIDNPGLENPGIGSLLVGGPPQGASGLQAVGVSAWFGENYVLDRVDLAMAPAQVTALIGPSGCGKSTFLRILNRMHELVPGAALGGEVLLDGIDIYADGTRPQEVRKRVGMVFQKPNPFPAASIRENVLSGLKLSRIKTTDADALVELSLTRAGLWREVRDRLDDPGGALSGGQQQRLSVSHRPNGRRIGLYINNFLFIPRTRLHRIPAHYLVQ